MSLEPWQLRRILELKFEEDKTQAQIAAELGLGQAKVSRAITEAREQGYIRTLIYLPHDEGFPERVEALADRLQEKGIVELRVAGGSGLAAIAAEAVKFFSEKGQSGQTVLVDGGTTVRSFVRAVPPRLFQQMKVVPLCADPPSDESSAFQVMTILGEKFAPSVDKKSLPYFSSPLLQSLIDDVRETAMQADFAFLGVAPFYAHGVSSPYDFIMHLGLIPEEIRSRYPDIRAFCGNYALAADGRWIPVPQFDDRMPWTLRFEDLQGLAAARRPGAGSSDEVTCHSTLLVAGEEKLEAAVAVLEARICNTMIIDRELAEVLIGHFQCDLRPR